VIPEGWREVRLENIAQVERGKFSARPRNDPSFYGGNIPFVQTGDISAAEGKLTNYSQTLNEQGLAVSRLFPKGTILITIAANIGDVALTTFDVACPDSLVAVQVKKGTSNEWLAYYLQTRKQELDRAATQNAQKNINLQVLRPLKILLPPLPEQRAIAAILGTWDRAIALTERRLAAAEQRKKALMQQLLTGRVRFPEFAGEEWREVRLGQALKERKERGYDDLPLLSVTADQGIIYRDELERRDTSNADKSKYLRVREGDIAYNTMRMWQGRSGVSELEGIVSPAYTVCTPKPSTDIHFVGHLFQLPSIIYLFYRYSQGLVSDTWNLKFTNLGKIKVQLPGLEEQRRIAAVLNTCDRELDLLRRKRDALQAQKQGLMQRLLTGRVRVHRT